MITTRGIVLNTVRYSDSSVIARVYTEEVGLRSFMVRVGKGRKALTGMALLQPLTPVVLSFINDARRNLYDPRSLEREVLLNSIPFDTVKTCIALFMAEVVGRSIAEEEANGEKFRFIHGAVLMLDAETRPVNNFHLKFMVEFSRHLGFHPHHRTPDQRYFDLAEGEFTVTEPAHPHMLDPEAADRLETLMDIPLNRHHELRLDTAGRRYLLRKLVDYYRLHLDGMKEITSHLVLEEVLG